MLRHFPTEKLVLVKKDGRRFEFVGLVGSGSIHTDDAKLQVEPGDEVERVLPNGLAEVHEIDASNFYRGMHRIPDHYQMKTRQKGSRRPTPPMNVIHIGELHGGLVQQGTVNSTQTGTFNLGADLSDLKALIETARAQLPKIGGLSQEQREEAESYIEAIEKQTKLFKPNPGFVRSALGGLKNVVEIAVGDVMGVVLLASLKMWAAKHGWILSD